MSTPHTIVEAYQALTQPPSAASDISVDIVGFVKNISMSHPSAALAGRQRSLSPIKCRLWLVDDSCCGLDDDDHDDSSSSIRSAQFVIYNAAEAAKLEQERIQEGGLLRLNGVVLSKQSAQANGIAVASPCFQFSLHAEPGQGWACLGAMDLTTNLVTFTPKRATGANATRPLPGTMATSQERIQELTAWFVKSYHSPHPVNPKESGTATMNLSSLPCRNRRLDELLVSLGLLSNIKVQVTNVYSQPSAMVTSDSRTRSSKKRKRQLSVPALALATVTDESGTAMTLVDNSGRFLPILNTAVANRKDTRLVVTNVLTKAQSSLRGAKSACATNETALVTTNETAMFLVPFDPNRVATQTQETGDCSLHGGGNSNNEMFLISELHDLVIDGASVKQSDESLFSSTSAYCDTVLEKHVSGNTGSRHYKSSANVVLDGDSIDTTFIAITPTVLKCLCGGLEADDLIESESLCGHSMQFLQSLIRDKVELKWTIQVESREQHNPFVIKAALHRLP